MYKNMMHVAMLSTTFELVFSMEQANYTPLIMIFRISHIVYKPHTLNVHSTTIMYLC